ncbi:MAG: ParB/RepB/Spo0J family partition protein [Eubacteriales bacterium]|nr:ParB/RepB/Spo0J family partition protein [Eubacteriales bacterium]
MEIMNRPENELVYLKTSELYPHPDNPRKNIGDVSELADSIRKNGILQNLTVVRGHKAEVKDDTNDLGKYLPDGYTVIIGHRRLAAAKMAGLEHVPCAVANMTPAEQFHTMMVENMQREDLTPMQGLKIGQSSFRCHTKRCLRKEK